MCVCRLFTLKTKNAAGAIDCCFYQFRLIDIMQYSLLYPQIVTLLCCVIQQLLKTTSKLKSAAASVFFASFELSAITIDKWLPARLPCILCRFSFIPSKRKCYNAAMFAAKYTQRESVGATAGTSSNESTPKTLLNL